MGSGVGVEVMWKDASQRDGSAPSGWLVRRDVASYARLELLLLQADGQLARSLGLTH